MKVYFIILGFILLINSSVSALSYYSPTYKTYRYNNLNRLHRPVYNPYSQYNSYQRYKNANKNNINRIKRMQNIRKLNRAKRVLNNVSGLFGNNNSYYPGTLTGYSVPISKDIYNQIDVYSNNANVKYKKPLNNTNLFSLPSGNEYYFQDGRYYKNSKDISGSTGVTIIYD